MVLMNEGLFLCQFAADKSGADVMKLPPHNINLGWAWAQAELHILLLSCWLTYSLLVLHNVIPPVLLCEVRCQHIETSSELWEHHVIRVTCAGEYKTTTLYPGSNWRKECHVSIPGLSMGFEPSPHLACRSGAHRVAWSHAAEHGARLHPPVLGRDLQPPLEPHIPLLWTGIQSEPWGHLPLAICSEQSESWTSATYQEEHPGKDRAE